MRYDLHCHTIYSKHWLWGVDAVSAPRDMVKTAVKKGLSGLAVTDHDNVKGSLVAKEFAKSYKKGFKIITGSEIRTADGDVLALGIKENIPGRLSVEETVEKISDLGGVSVAAHPYATYMMRTCVKEKAVKADAIEVFNAGSSSPGANARAKKLAEKFKKPMTAGSDAHYHRHVGNAGIICDGDPLEAIMKGKTRIFGSYTPKYQFGYVILRKAIRLVKWRFLKPKELKGEV